MPEQLFFSRHGGIRSESPRSATVAMEYDLTGLSRQAELLNSMTHAVRSVILRDALRKAMPHIVKAARRNLKRQQKKVDQFLGTPATGSLANSLAIKVMTMKSGVTVGMAGPRKDSSSIRRGAKKGTKRRTRYTKRIRERQTAKRIRIAEIVGVEKMPYNINPAKYAHLVEFGHEKVIFGRRTGQRVRAYPFMRPALLTSKQAVTHTIVREVRRGIEKVAVRARRHGPADADTADAFLRGGFSRQFVKTIT